MHRRWKERLIVVVAAASLSGCRCKGDAKVGDKRAFACAEVPSRDAREEVDLGDGKKLVRDGVRAVLRGVPDDAPIAVTSFEGGLTDAKVPSAVGAVFVIGLGGHKRDALATALSSLAKQAPLVVAVMGPEDEADLARAAMNDAGKRVVDGGVVRALAAASLEVITVPGSDDPASLPEHGRGCVVRADDVKALANKLGAAGDKPRVALVYAAPARNAARASALDHLPGVAAWLVGGPLDRDTGPELAIAAGAPAPMIAVPRVATPRTTSTPGVVPPGFLLLRADGRNVQVKREE